MISSLVIPARPLRKLAERSASPLGRERADVELVDDLAFGFYAGAKVAIAPRERARIDDLRERPSGPSG